MDRVGEGFETCSRGHKCLTATNLVSSFEQPKFELFALVRYIGTEVSDQKRNSTINIRLYNNLKKVHNFSQIFEQNIHKAF